MPRPSERGSIRANLIWAYVILCCLGGLALLPGAFSSTPVQQKAAQETGNDTTISLTLDSTPTVGNSIVCVISSGAELTIPSSVTGAGVTFAAARNSNTRRYVGIWYGTNSSGASATIDVTYPTNVGGREINCTEWSGMQTASPVDTSGASNGKSTVTATTATITPTSSVERLFIAGTRIGGAVTFSSGPTNSFTLLTASAQPAGQGAYRVVTTTSGTYNTAITYSTSGDWDAAIAAFIPAAAGGSTLKDPIGRGIIPVPRAMLGPVPRLGEWVMAWFGRRTKTISGYTAP